MIEAPIEDTTPTPTPTPTSPPTSPPAPALTKDDREKLKTKLLLKHLRKNRVITLGTVLFITCLISAGLIEIYLRWFLPPGSGSTAIRPDFTGSFKDSSDGDGDVWTDIEDSDAEVKCSIKGINRPIRRRYRVLTKPRKSLSAETKKHIETVDTAENSDSGLPPDSWFYTINWNEQIQNQNYSHPVAIGSDEESEKEEEITKVSNLQSENLQGHNDALPDSHTPAPKLSAYAEHANKCPLVAISNFEVTFDVPETASLPIPTRFITLKDKKPLYDYTTLADIVDNYVPFSFDLDALDAVKKTSKGTYMNELIALYAFTRAILNYALSISVYSEFSSVLRTHQSIFKEPEPQSPPQIVSLKKLSAFAETWSFVCGRLRVSTHSIALRALKNIHKYPVQRPFSPSLPIRTITDFYLQYDSFTYGRSSEYKLFLIDPTVLPTVSEASLTIKGEYQQVQWTPTLSQIIILIESVSLGRSNFDRLPREAFDFGVKELFFLVNYYNETVLRLQVPEIVSVEREIMRTLRDPSFVPLTVHEHDK